jgi:tripartite-type tricarboxylate transporter receptor subunit TctC
MKGSVTIQRSTATVVAGVLAAGLAAPTGAQEYPSRPVRIVVPFSPGGPAELIARLAGQKLSDSMGQPFIVDARGGGGGTIASEIVAKAPPDGYTLMLHTVGHVITPALYRKLPYSVERDFVPVAVAYTSQLVLIVHSSVPARTVKELIALARAKPRQINYASSGSGGISHLAAHLFQTMAGIELTHIPYKGMAPGLTDVVAGQVQMVMPDPAVALPHVRSGKVYALGLTGTKHIPSAPQIPTLAEAGVPGYNVPVWYGFLAPRGTPRAIVDKLHAGVVKAMASPDLRDRYINEGADPTVLGPEAFDTLIRAELVKWAKVVKDSGVRID